MKRYISKKIDENTYINIKISTDGIGNEKPYFSITGELREKNEYGLWKLTACGCLHNDIIKVAPELKPLVDIHLSDIYGIPMHASQNGWYWLAKACGIEERYQPEQSHEECLENFCALYRIDKEEGNNIKDRVTDQYLLYGKDEASLLYKIIGNGFLPRWEKQAEEALKLIESIPTQ